MYEFKQVTTDEKGIHQCAALLRVVFPMSDNFTDAYVKWEYSDNPVGKIVGFNAFEGDELAAHYVTQPAIANIFGKQTKGLLSLNTATHPNHQGKKLFTTLAEMTYQCAAANGYEFVFGVANANSTPGFIKKLGFQLIAPLEAKLGLGNINKQSGSKEYCFERIWTNETLNWRMKNPQHGYEISGNRIYAPTGKYGIKAIIGDFDSRLFDKIPSIKIPSFNPLRLYMGLDSSINWKSSKFYEVPKKMRPSPLNLIFKDLTGNNLQPDVSAIKFQTIDFDAY